MNECGVDESEQKWLSLFASFFANASKGAAMNCGSMYIVPRETEKCHWTEKKKFNKILKENTHFMAEFMYVLYVLYIYCYSTIS